MNLSELVTVRWTDAGLWLLKRAMDDPQTVEIASEQIAQASKSHGACDIQLWALMRLIGPHLQLGSGAPFIEENEVQVGLLSAAGANTNKPAAP
ncbi:hypothetical protein [Aurantimonas sp. 22II-16-19i]|uniref:hypothetical protein n=1 Tax=Aurantimonas sp. 22II-16-19i TaxID=1317114 RepID=UPI0009F7B6DC|nr:hypothetical protein [Aurantimonas sp. 22II-16-19i]ORE93941.1 hypothetical protein ATO4_14344 [Aurantimonas sp. 22II-16-19i]